MKKLIVVLVLMIVGLCVLANMPTKKSSSGCELVEYNPPYQIVFIDGTADVHRGVDAPQSNVKGTITGGAAGIEAKCGIYYRLQGVDWWGWVRVTDINK